MNQFSLTYWNRKYVVFYKRILCLNSQSETPLHELFHPLSKSISLFILIIRHWHLDVLCAYSAQLLKFYLRKYIHKILQNNQIQKSLYWHSAMFFLLYVALKSNIRICFYLVVMFELKFYKSSIFGFILRKKIVIACCTCNRKCWFYSAVLTSE